MTILVTGATGNVGSAVLNQLPAAGVHARAAARTIRDRTAWLP